MCGQTATMLTVHHIVYVRPNSDDVDDPSHSICADKIYFIEDFSNILSLGFHFAARLLQPVM